MPSANLFAGVPDSLPEEMFETLAESEHVRIERIVSQGHASPADYWYDQEEHEWVLLLQGRAELRFEDELLPLAPGDYVNIPAHRRHRVESTSAEEQTVWLAVFYR